MTRLRMHWKVVQAIDGRKHLDMNWEEAHARTLATVPMVTFNMRGAYN